MTTALAGHERTVQPAGHRMGGSARTITALGGNLIVLGYAGKPALGV